MTNWEERLAQWEAELELVAQLEGIEWVPLARAEEEAGVSRSALRSWYRTGQIDSRIVDGPHGPQRLVRLDEVLDRAAKSARYVRRAEREVALEAQVAVLQHRVHELEARFAAIERRIARTE